jgi:hypothetical protein
MAATRTNIDAKLEELSRRERKLRQDEIIAELMGAHGGHRAQCGEEPARLRGVTRISRSYFDSEGPHPAP